MPEIRRCLKQHEPFILEAISEKYRISMVHGGLFDKSELLAQHLLSETVLKSIVESFSRRTLVALADLIQHQQIRSDTFFSKYGEIRVMGEARFKRERPDRTPENSSEELLYAGILFRGMFDEGNGLMEYVFIPSDLLPLLPKVESTTTPAELRPGSLIIRPAVPEETRWIVRGNDEILDISCLILASIRIGQDLAAIYPVYEQMKTDFTKSLLHVAEILNESDQPNVTTAQLFLQKDRIPALLQLFQVWQNSESFDELSSIDKIKIDSHFQYDPLALRTVLLDMLAMIRNNRWWSMSGFIAAVKSNHGDFLRPQNVKDSWLIQNTEQADSTKWENIEGVYLTSLINGPLKWLGMVDLGYSEDQRESEKSEASAFRLNQIGITFLSADNELSQLVFHDNKQYREKQNPTITIDGRITVTRTVSRILRYHIARFCEWEKIQKELWRFRVTPVSLRKARESGLNVNAFVRMLKRTNERGFPVKLEQAISKWDQDETQSTIFEATLLTVTDPAWIDALMSSRDAAHWVEQRLNANTVVIKSKGIEAVRRVLIEKSGILTECDH